MTSTACNDDHLRHLLMNSDAVSDDHVESCDRCQQRLVELAAGPEQWQEIEASLSECELSDTYEQERTLTSWQSPVTAVPSRWTEAMSRQLLDPPTHPEMLGRIGRYEVERLIGSGGMGIVFKAFDSELNRPVAIKVLAMHLAGSGAARHRFAREARAAAAIDQEHVVAIHNVESEAEPPFLVMQYVAGESLQQRLDRSGPLELCEILRIARQTALGLSAAHDQGLVHRDVKPSNILLAEGVDRALLTDFGLARASDDAGLTHSGHMPGTPHYMSPEQARGDSIDHRSDLFSLGSLMYAMCTGWPPFRAESAWGILRRITDEEPRTLAEVNPQTPGWLSRLISTLHSKSAADRYSSAAEVAELLEQCLAHAQQPTVHSLPESLVEAPAKRSSLKMWLWAGAVCLAIGVAAILVRPEVSDNIPGGGSAAQQISVTSTPEESAGPTLPDSWQQDDAEIEQLRQETDSLTEQIQRLWDE